MTRFSGSDATSAFCRYRTPTDAGLPLDGLPDLCLGGEPRLRRRHRSTMCYTCAPLSAKGGREVKIDVGLRSDDLHALGREAAAYERLGADGLWSFETAHDPFLPLFAAALTTQRVSLGTAIAVAFARTPYAVA